MVASGPSSNYDEADFNHGLLVGTNFTSDMTVSVADLTITVTDVSFLTSETATATFLISDPAHGGRNVSTSLRHLHSEFKLP